MPTAYTPGLRVAEQTTIRKTRRLPLKGAVLVTAGDQVTADQVVARAQLPGAIQAVRAAEQLGIAPPELTRLLRKGEGDAVTAGEVLVETKGMFGLFAHRLVAPVSGVIEYISPITGTLGLREHPVPLELPAYVDGTVAEVMPDEGAVIVTRGALAQGIFGVGGERRGRLLTVAPAPDAPLDDGQLTAACAGCVLLGGATANVVQIRRAIECGAVGLIVGAVSDAVLRAYLGYDIGVAITGQEEVPLTLILTEGFGSLAMAERTYRLLDALGGRWASINGATQIRAGVIRPEVIVPTQADAANVSEVRASELRIGCRVRLIREPFFGRFAVITALPPDLHPIETEAMVRVTEVRFDEGHTALVPRANVEIIEG